MAVSDAAGTCLAVHVDVASPHEVKLVQQIASRYIKGKHEKLIGDKAMTAIRLTLSWLKMTLR